MVLNLFAIASIKMAVKNRLIDGRNKCVHSFWKILKGVLKPFELETTLNTKKIPPLITKKKLKTNILSIKAFIFMIGVAPILVDYQNII